MSKNENRYKDLLSNTVLFALGTFGSKFIVFFLMPLYTSLLLPAESGAIEIITDTCNLIIPFMYLSIHEAVIRFGLEKSNRKEDVYTTSILVTLAGYALVWLFFPLLRLYKPITPYMHLIYLYILASALRSVTTHFVRALGHVRLFALDGMTTVIINVGLNLLFLIKFRMGVTGAVLSTIIADFVSALFLTIYAKTYQYFDVKNLNRSVSKSMIRYSAPLVPTAIFWWITNLSDIFVIEHFLGLTESGIYVYAGKIPRLITLVSQVFIQAWQLSAFDEQDSEDGGLNFYSNVFRSYYTLIFIAVSGLILIIRPVMRIMVAPSYYEGWRYAPFLLLSVGFSCFVTFLGTIYNVAKENKMVTITTAAGAAINIVLNIILTPIYGSQGAAFATFISYFVVFAIRVIDTRKYMALDIRPIRIGLSLLAVLAQTWVSLAQPKYGIAVQVVLLLGVVAINFKQLEFMVTMFMGGVKKFIAKRKAS